VLPAPPLHLPGTSSTYTMKKNVSSSLMQIMSHISILVYIFAIKIGHIVYSALCGMDISDVQGQDYAGQERSGVERGRAA